MGLFIQNRSQIELNPRNGAYYPNGDGNAAAGRAPPDNGNAAG